MFRFTPGSECQQIKTIVFTYKTTEALRNSYIDEEQFELAAEAQQQLKELKQSLFDILLSDRYVINQTEDHAIIVSAVK